MPVIFRTAPEALPTKTFALLVREPERVIVPALTVVVPFQEFAAPERVSEPFPDLVRPYEPPRTLPETLSVAVPTEPPLLTVQVGVAPRVIFEEMVSVMAEVLAELVTVMAELVPSVMLPPERVMFEEEPTRVIVFALTLPETVIVPVPSWLALVPKFRASVVAVVVLPVGSVAPVEDELQPWVASFVVGAAQVPVAVPKPVVEPLLSQ